MQLHRSHFLDDFEVVRIISDEFLKLRSCNEGGNGLRCWWQRQRVDERSGRRTWRNVAVSEKESDWACPTREQSVSTTQQTDSQKVSSCKHRFGLRLIFDFERGCPLRAKARG